jgi:hypothetical protein
MLAEQEALRQFKKESFHRTERQGLRDWIGRAMVAFVFRKGIRVKVPLPLRHVIPVRQQSFEEVWQGWDELRSELAAYLNGLREEDLTRIVCRHPVAGRLNVIQTLDLLESHLNHHQRQVERTEKAVIRL